MKFLLPLLALASAEITMLSTKYQTNRAEDLFMPMYYKAKLCETSIWQNFDAVTVSLIIPENPECQNKNLGCVYVEAFNNTNYQGAPIATNYFAGTSSVNAYAKFVIKYDPSIRDKQDFIYFRMWLWQSSQMTSMLRLEPSNDAPTKGQYIDGFFPPFDSNKKIERFDQYTHLDGHSSVKNGDKKLYGINFCVENENGRGIGLSVIAMNEFAGFNTYVCDETTVSDEDRCAPGGKSVITCGNKWDPDAECMDNRDQPFNNIDIPHGFSDQLLVAAVIGMGGDPTMENSFNLYAKLTQADE